MRREGDGAVVKSESTKEEEWVRSRPDGVIDSRTDRLTRNGSKMFG